MKTLKTIIAILIPLSVVVALTYGRIHYANTLPTNFIIGVFDGVMFPYLMIYTFTIDNIPNYATTPFISFYFLGYIIGVLLMTNTLFNSIKNFRKI